MTPETLTNAIIEAQRFLKLAKNVHIRKCHGALGVGYAAIDPGKDSSACRRASMDLSRALSELRK